MKHHLPRWLVAVLALGAGGMLTLAFAPLQQPLAGLVALAVLIGLTLRSRSGWGAFAVGWLFGVAHHVTALGWIAEALMVDATRFAALIPLTKLGIPVCLGLYTGAVSWLTWQSRCRGVAALCLFAVLWSIAEYARSYLFLPFAWNLTGYIWADVPVISQSVALFGIPGLGLLTVLAAGSLALPVLIDRRTAGRMLTVTFIAGVLVAGFGVVRLVMAKNNTHALLLRLVQPNIPQDLKWDDDAMEGHFAQLLRLSSTPTDRQLAAIIWPESATGWRLQSDTPRRMRAVAALPTGAVLITGLNRWGTPREGQPRPHNSLFVFDRSGAILGMYDKHRLVPFGEYVPFRSVFNVDKVAGGPMLDFIPGDAGITTMAPESALPAFSPLICYEAIYAGGVVRRDGPRPQWLLNITNDAWFGQSAGPYQHLAMTRMRAIEEGLPLVRVANTGITTVVDPWGRALVATRLGEARVVDVPLPHAMAPPPFARWGHLIPALMLAACLMIACFIHLRSRYAALSHPALSPVPR